jgi:hypothetical protein
MTDDTSRANEILDQIETGHWSHAQVRHRMLPLKDAALDAIERDESRRDIERMTARAILKEREAQASGVGTEGGEAGEASNLVGALAGISEDQVKVSEAQRLLEAAQGRKAARLAAREVQPPAAVETVEIAADARSKNELAAHQFAGLLCEAGIQCKPMRTKAIAGRGPVVDGWVVNYRDNASEIGIVAAWWGRQHFTAFVEVAGHAERTVETALLFRKLVG